MINAVLSLRVVGKAGATVSKGVKGGSSTSFSSDSSRGKDAPSLHRLTSSLGKLDLRSISCDRSYSRILLTNLIYCSFIISIILDSLAQLYHQKYPKDKNYCRGRNSDKSYTSEGYNQGCKGVGCKNQNN